jgi:hypothetical protein
LVVRRWSFGKSKAARKGGFFSLFSSFGKSRWIFETRSRLQPYLTANMNVPLLSSRRKIFGRLSVGAGNVLQVAGIAAACFLLVAARSSHSAGAVVAMVAAWILLYFCCHAIAHWAAGRVLGIRLAFYTVGGTANPAGWPFGLRWLFEHLPFLGVQTEKSSMQQASPISKAIMWSAGVTSSAIIPTLGAFWSWRAGVTGSKWFFLFALGWSAGTLASNWTSQTGDYSKARRALGKSSK